MIYEQAGGQTSYPHLRLPIRKQIISRRERTAASKATDAPHAIPRTGKAINRDAMHSAARSFLPPRPLSTFLEAPSKRMRKTRRAKQVACGKCLGH